MSWLRGVSVFALVIVGACGGNKGDDDDDGNGSGEGVTLSIEPASAAVTLAPSGAAFKATQSFKVFATEKNGTKTDVTGQVAWLEDDEALVFDLTGLATVTAAGPYAFTADFGGAQAQATLTASLTASVPGPGFDPGDTGKLDGTPDAAQVPTIAYPIAGALFPINVAPIEVHVQKSDPSQAIARVDLTSGGLLAYRFYAKCAASPNPGSFANACIVTIGGEAGTALASQLAGASEKEDIQISVRLAAADGTKLGASAPTAVAWSKVALTGGLYYWTTSSTETFGTAIARYNFNGDASTPEIYLASKDAPTSTGQPQCIGCHALSPDGAKLSFGLGGSTPGYFSLFDVATTKPTQSKIESGKKFAVMSTFSPDGSRIVTMNDGKLTLRTADAALDVVTDDLFTADVGEKISHPFWSPTGNYFAFVSWNPSPADIQAGQNTGDMVKGGQIWIANSDGSKMTSAPKKIVERIDGKTNYYPAISDDDRFVVFNQSRCDGPQSTANGWGVGPCDGYNDISASLQLVSVNGGTAVPLTRANGAELPTTTNSWPRWSPDHGTFRGKRLYWVAFSSRRTYGLSLLGTTTKDDTKPQLWFAAVAVPDDGTTPTADPSFAPVWLPGQNPDMKAPRGNHTPAWTSKVVIIQ